MKKSRSKRKPGRRPKEAAKAQTALQIRMTLRRKQAYTRVSGREGLSAWAQRHLDQAAGYTPEGGVL